MAAESAFSSTMSPCPIKILKGLSEKLEYLENLHKNLKRQEEQGLVLPENETHYETVVMEPFFLFS